MSTAFSVSVNIGGKVLPSLGSAVRAAEAQVKGLAGRLATLHTGTVDSFARIGRSVATAGERMQRAGTGMAIGVTTPLALLGKAGFDAAYQFQKVGNAVQAVTLITDEQRSKLEAYTKSLNKLFPYSNAEIMGAAFELSRAGMNIEQVLGSLKGSLNLGLAGDIGLPEAADISTNIMTSMGLPIKTAEEAAKSLTKVVDALAYAANRSNTDVRLMGETFKYVGPMARAAGMDISKVSAAAMVMANNGIKGSEAGVAMRSALVRMVRPTKPMLAALQRLNLDLGQFVKSGREITSADIIGSLGVDGIDASGAKKAIDKLLRDKKLQAAPGELIKRLTAAVSSTLGKDSVVDKEKLSDNISEALTTAGSEVDLFGFVKAMKERGATLADIARVFDARQGARLITLLFSDLDAVLADVEKNAAGTADRMAAVRMKGIVGDLAAFKAGLENLWVSIGESGVLRDLGAAFSNMAAGLQKLAEASPVLIRLGAHVAAATAALGPFLIVAGASARVLGPLVKGLGLLASAATVGLAARLVGVARGITALSVAVSVGLVSRLRTLATAIGLLAVPGGAGLVLAGMARSLGRLAKAVLLFPLTALRSIGAVLTPIGALTGAGVVAIVGGLVALGTWVSNNWEGVKTFAESFASSFSKNLGPGAAAGVEKIASALGTAWDWLRRLVGPIDETGARWRAWGETVGGVVAGAVNTVASAIERVIGLFATAIERAQALSRALSEIAGRAPATAGPAVPSIGGLGGSAEFGGARALGGPVRAGVPYLVGERGPEIFVPRYSGHIETNAAYRRMAEIGRPSLFQSIRPGSNAPAASAGRIDMDSAFRHLRAKAVEGERAKQGGVNRPASVTYSPTFHINGAQDPAAIVREVDRYITRLQYEQRHSLSD
ncbi:MAG TPA: phage tail tape measure protein [Microvirga sp.]|jgi:TP901 family phage tail tape measure protein|nr:phage tail tape measure protein [Microvirga sp.]